MAMANMMGMAASTSQSTIEKETEDIPMDFRATGKSITIAGYKANEYIAENDESQIKVYMSTEVGMDWKEAFVSTMQRFSPGLMQAYSGMMDGMVLKSVNTDKKKNEIQTFEVIEVDTGGKIINKSEYTW